MTDRPLTVRVQPTAWVIYCAAPSLDGACNRWEPWKLLSYPFVLVFPTAALAQANARHLRQTFPGNLFVARPTGSPPKSLP
jgi:hypothetical protein